MQERRRVSSYRGVVHGDVWWGTRRMIETIEKQKSLSEYSYLFTVLTRDVRYVVELTSIPLLQQSRVEFPVQWDVEQ